MVHGDEKARDMTRSLLPSRHRASARYERATIHRAARRQSRVEMAQFVRDPEAFEDLASLDEDVKGEIDLMVCGRRQGDKVAPFIRWARAITRETPQERWLEHVRSLVPPGIIGDHALLHLSATRGFEHPAETAHREALRRRWARNSNPPWLERGEQAELLRALLRAPGGHRAFNRWILDPLTHRHRPLLGEHDVLPFLAAMWEQPGGAQNERYSSRRFRGRHDRWTSPTGPYAHQASAVNTFLRTLKKHRRDVDATVKALRLESPAYSMALLGKPPPLPAQWERRFTRW